MLVRPPCRRDLKPLWRRKRLQLGFSESHSLRFSVAVARVVRRRWTSKRQRSYSPIPGWKPSSRHFAWSAAIKASSFEQPASTRARSVATTQSEIVVGGSSGGNSRSLFVWRRRKRRRRIFNDRLPMMKAGDQRTATNDGDDGGNETHDFVPLKRKSDQGGA